MVSPVVVKAIRTRTYRRRKNAKFPLPQPHTPPSSKPYPAHPSVLDIVTLRPTDDTQPNARRNGAGPGPKRGRDGTTLSRTCFRRDGPRRHRQPVTVPWTSHWPSSFRKVFRRVLLRVLLVLASVLLLAEERRRSCERKRSRCAVVVWFLLALRVKEIAENAPHCLYSFADLGL
ncbi:hypothetical protein JTB14_012439 [Gonioctena quinquepunctata]|nr:hypothetical protein JTB14_012439 [Gonioctena quinquepunctata]